jgi:hypothetical protein
MFFCFDHDDTQRILHVGANAAEIPRPLGNRRRKRNTGPACEARRAVSNDCVLSGYEAPALLKSPVSTKKSSHTWWKTCLLAKRINVFFLDPEFSHQKIPLYAPALLKSPVWTKNPRIRGGKVASCQTQCRNNITFAETYVSIAAHNRSRGAFLAPVQHF